MDYIETKTLHNKTLTAFTAINGLSAYMSEVCKYTPHELDECEEWLANQIFKLNKALAEEECKHD